MDPRLLGVLGALGARKKFDASRQKKGVKFGGEFADASESEVGLSRCSANHGLRSTRAVHYMHSICRLYLTNGRTSGSRRPCPMRRTHQASASTSMSRIWPACSSLARTKTGA